MLNEPNVRSLSVGCFNMLLSQISGCDANNTMVSVTYSNTGNQYQRLM